MRPERNPQRSTGHHVRVTGPSRRRLVAGCCAALAAVLSAAACDPATPTPTPGTASPSATPFPEATLDPSSIDLLHLADEPPPPPDHLDPAAHGLTADYTDPLGAFTQKVPPGGVTVATNGIIATGQYRAPVTLYSPQRTALSPPDTPEIDSFTVSDLQTSADPGSLERRVLSWETDRLGQITGTRGVGLVGQRTGTFRQLPAMVFKLRAGGTQLKVLVLVLGHSVYVISMAGTDDPPASFDAFAVSFHLMTNPSPQPTPSLPPPPQSGTPSPSPSPSNGQSPGTSPTPGGITPVPGGFTPGPGGGSPPPV
jgi:hypothetical protein